MASSAGEASNASFRSLQDADNVTIARKWKWVHIGALVSAAMLASLVAFVAWPFQSEVAHDGVIFPEPTSVNHANDLLQDLPQMDPEELYKFHVAPYVPLMYQQFLKSHGSTAPELQKASGAPAVYVLDSQTFSKRLGIFGENVKEIIKLNAQMSAENPDRATFAINVFADWSKDELSTLTTVHLPIPPQVPSEFATDTSKVGAPLEMPLALDSCADKESKTNCDGWKASGYCTSDSQYYRSTIYHCAATCGECGCSDLQSESNCKYWERSGYCKQGSQYEKYTTYNCKKTCGACGSHEECDCKDDDTSGNCPGWANAGYCTQSSQYHDYVALHCKKSCKECSDHCDDNDGKSRNWATMYPEAFGVRNQGQCGSCWAHSTTNLLRQHWTIKHIGTETGKLSVQWVLDCVTPFRNTAKCGNMGIGGCCGGWPYKALEYIVAHGGIPTKAAYGPYDSKGQGRFTQHECRPVTKLMTTSGPRYFKTETDLKTAMLKDGSASITIHANDAWFKYQNGVVPASACDPGQGINHAVMAVGYIDEKSAWLIMNSWGKSWGCSPNPPYPHVEGGSGFLLMQYGQNACNIEQVASVMPADVSRVGSAEAVAQGVPPPPGPEALVPPPQPDTKIFL